LYLTGLKYKIDVNKYEIYSVEYGFEKILRYVWIKRFFGLFELPLMILDVIVQYPRFRSIRADLIYINNGGYPAARTCRSAVLTARILGIKKCLLVVNNIAVPYNSFKRLLDYPVDILIKNCVDLYLTASDAAKKALANVLNLSKDKVLLALNTFDIDPVTVSAEQLRCQLKIGSSDFVIGCIGELAKRKGHHVLVDAINDVLTTTKVQGIKVVIIGSGQEKENLQYLIARHGLTETIQLIEFTDNVFNYYNIFDLYVHPSIAFDDLPFTVREAMSLSLPIIASDSAGIPELIEHNYNGLLVRPGDSKDLSEKICELIEDRYKREAIGKNNVDVYEKKLSQRVILKNYDQLFSTYTE
jgi:glycosyltransferase involved in cell wall biosynthesis